MDNVLNPTPRLRLVYSRREKTSISPSLFLSPDTGVQASLFAQPKPGMIVFVQFSDIEDTDFVEVMTSAKPSYVFDLRLVPHFDVGILNRSVVFELFDRMHITYVDTTAPLMSGNERNEVLNRLADVLRHRVDMKRPLVFLLGTSKNSAASDLEILELLSAAGKDASEVLTIPA